HLACAHFEARSIRARRNLEVRDAFIEQDQPTRDIVAEHGRATMRLESDCRITRRELARSAVADHPLSSDRRDAIADLTSIATYGSKPDRYSDHPEQHHCRGERDRPTSSHPRRCLRRSVRFRRFLIESIEERFFDPLPARLAQLFDRNPSPEISHRRAP